MQSWRREPAEEVVHTATFHGAPLACATAIATLDALRVARLPERAAEVGGAIQERPPRKALARCPGSEKFEGKGS